MENSEERVDRNLVNANVKKVARIRAYSAVTIRLAVRAQNLLFTP